MGESSSWSDDLPSNQDSSSSASSLGEPKVMKRSKGEPRVMERLTYGSFHIDSVLKLEDFSIYILQCQIPHIGLELLKPRDRITNPPPDRIQLYEECLRARLRLSLSNFVVEIFNSFSIAPCYAVPNS